MKESKSSVNAAQDVQHLQYIELLTKYEQQQVLLDKQKLRSEQLLQQVMELQQQLQQCQQQIEHLIEENELVNQKYKIQLQRSADNELRLEEQIVQLQLKNKNALETMTKATSNIETPLTEKRDVKKVEQSFKTPSVVAEIQEQYVEKKKPIPKPTSSKTAIANTLKAILHQEEQAVSDNNFRTDEDEHQFAEAIQQHLLHKQHAPKILDSLAVTTYEELHQEKAIAATQKNPYFARMDFKIGNDNKAYYIGKNPIDQYVIPWQSRIAKAFYTLSMEEEFALNAEQSGVLEYRRNIDFKDGKISYLHEPETLENATNQAVVHRIENKRGKEMEAIVETIQKQQYEIISLPLTKPIIVQGSAGSGKSAIALHRLSYILANDKQLNEKNIAIFTPNEAFLHHIKEVLPQLGHEHIQQFTLPQFIAKRTGCKWSNKQLDEHLTFEATVAYGEQLEKEIEALLQQQPAFKEIVATQLDGVEIVVAARTIKTIIERLEKYPQHKKRIAGKKMLEKALDDCIERKAVEELCHFSSSRLTANNRLYLVKHAKAQLVDTFTKQYRRYELQMVLTIAQQLLNWTGPFERVHMAPLLHTFMIVNGKRPMFEYVIVDEAQDYTPYEIWLLNQLTKNKNIMLVGDMAQAIQPYYQPETWQAYEPAIGEYDLYALTHTYRSTMQIVEAANKIILPMSEGKFEVATFNPRLGSDVRKEHVLFELLPSRVEYWVTTYMALGYQSFAFVTTAPDIDFDINIPVITTEHYGTVAGAKLVVGNPLELKGLEFDVVFVDELAPFPATPYGKKLQYVAYTRALHQLHVFQSE